MGQCCNRTSEKCENTMGRLQHSLHDKKKQTWHHLVVVLFLSSLFPCTSTTLHMMIFMRSNIQFCDKFRHTAQLNLIKDAAYISISHILHLSVDHKRISQQPELQLWCCHSEGFGDECAILWDRWDETQHTSSSEARGIFQCSFAHFTNFML